MSRKSEPAIGARIVAAAEDWIDTPFLWGQSVKGVGCDCKGLIAGVARDCDRPEADSMEALTSDYGAGRFESGRLMAGMARLFDRVRDPAPGDIAAMVVKGRIQHLAIVTAVADGRPVKLVEANLAVGRVRPVDVTSSRRFASYWRWRA